MLRQAKIDIHSKEFGVIVEAAAHRLRSSGSFYQGVENLHSAGWNRDVQNIVERLRDEGRLTSDALGKEIRTLIGSEKYSKFFEFALPAPMSHGDWGRATNKWDLYYQPLKERFIARIQELMSKQETKVAEAALERAKRRVLRKTAGRRVFRTVLPIAGALLGVWGFTENLEAKGVEGALWDEGLDSTPLLNIVKFAEDMIFPVIPSEDQQRLIDLRLRYLEISTGEQWEFERFGYSVTTGVGFVGSNDGKRWAIPWEKFNDYTASMIEGTSQ
jgi:hypothetical protein